MFKTLLARNVQLKAVFLSPGAVCDPGALDYEITVAGLYQHLSIKQDIIDEYQGITFIIL